MTWHSRACTEKSITIDSGVYRFAAKDAAMQAMDQKENR